MRLANVNLVVHL